MEPISPEPPPDPPDLEMTSVETEKVSTTGTKRPRTEEEQSGPNSKKHISNTESASASIQTVYTHPSIVVDGIRSYEATDSGPYIVHVAKTVTDPAASTEIKPIKFGQFLFTHKIENICLDGVKRVGRNKISITFQSASGANKFLNNPILKMCKYEAFIPTYNVTRMGLVRGVPVEWSMNDFVESLQIPGHCSYILKARRMNRKVKVDGNISWEPTQTAVLTFRGQQLPERVYSYYSSLTVEAYQYPTIQCMNCCRFGHIKAQCRSKPRCYRCAQPHLGDECSVQEAVSTCLYCSSHHFSTSRSCPEQDRQRSIKIEMARSGISYLEASSQFPNVRKTFTDAVKTTSAPTPHILSQPPLNAPNPPSQSYKKTVTNFTKPHAPLGKSFDKTAHQSIIANVPSSLPNGYALQMSQMSSSPPREESQDQLLVQLLTIIISIISQNSLNLPPNVAHMISQLSSLIDHNGPVSNNPVEYSQSSTEDS